jgi:hypothetical protein
MEFTEEQKKRFWDKVDKTDSCWSWTGGISNSGYGAICINYKIYKTHRISWLLAGNTIPDGHVIRHKCRNRHCLNPEHLETGTYADNNGIDRVRDGTDNRGEKNISAKLTATQVLEIRERATETYQRLAEEYGVDRTTISYIITRRTWKHI